MKNKYLKGSNIDCFKYSHKLAEININKALKKEISFGGNPEKLCNS